MIGIDLGCGRDKRPGLIGMDLYSLAGVDILADMNARLPFRDDSVDFVFASHSLEHVRNLLETVKDIYRICKHGAQVCVIAPYSEQKLNQANPYHTCVFNEHTPRFWTDYENTPVSVEEYYHPHASRWGLSRSDNSDPGIDIRLVRIEYFYFPQYTGLPPSEQRRLRLERPDVCDQIIYHLIVWKSSQESPAKSFDDYVAEFQPYEPEYIPLLRNRGRDLSSANAAAQTVSTESFLNSLTRVLHSKELEALREARMAEVQVSDRLRQDLAAAKDEATELRGHTLRLTGEITRLHEHCATQTEVLARRTAELQDIVAHNRTLRDEAARTARELEFAHAELRRQTDTSAAAQQEVSNLLQQIHELQANRESNDVLRARLGLTRGELETTATLLTLHRQKEDALTAEVASAKMETSTAVQQAEQFKTLWGSARRALGALSLETRIPEFVNVVRVGGFLVGRDRQMDGFPKEFALLHSYCNHHFGSKRAALIFGCDLSDTAYREYVIPFALDRLASITVAVRPLLPQSSGELGVEIVSHRSEILAHVRQRLTAVNGSGLATFQLPVPLVDVKRGWYLRIFVRDADGPVGVYELARGALVRSVTQFCPFVLFS